MKYPFSVEIKYGLNETLWYLKENQVVSQSPIEIKIYLDNTKTDVVYSFTSSSGRVERFEKDVFKTKEDLLASL